MQKYLTGGISGYDKSGSVVRIELFGNLDMKGMMHSVRKSDLEKVKLLECERVMKMTREKEQEVREAVRAKYDEATRQFMTCKCTQIQGFLHGWCLTTPHV